MTLVDSHCHLYYEPYVSNLENTIKDCKSNRINYLLSIGVDLETSKKNISISKKYSEIYCTIGLHPNNVKDKKQEIDKILNLYVPNEKIVGIGETGIDLYRSKDNLKDQIKYFNQQIEFAIKNNLPVVVHTRNADKETYEVLKDYKSDKLNFIIHSFSGTEDFAFKCLDLGGYISFNGILTFKNSKDVRSVCKKLPLDRILIETDSPYLTPEPLRGRINHPINVKLVAEMLARISGNEYDKICSVTYNNFKKFFNINENS